MSLVWLVTKSHWPSLSLFLSVMSVITCWGLFLYQWEAQGICMSAVKLHCWIPKAISQSFTKLFLNVRGFCICIHSSNMHTVWCRNTSGFCLHKIISHWEENCIFGQIVVFLLVRSCICWIHYLYVGMQEYVSECRTFIILCYWWQIADWCSHPDSAG